MLLLCALASRGQLDSAWRYELSVQDVANLPMSNRLEVFSASRSTKPLEDLPFTVHVITREEILRNGYISLVDALKTAPAMKVSQPGSGDEGEMFLMRGLLGNYYTKILINGIPVQPSVLGLMPLGAQLPVRQAERIEVIYGPASSVYGADAAAGVINIITKNADKDNFAQADAEVGEYGYNYLNFMIGGKLGKNQRVVQYTAYGTRYSRYDLNIKYDTKTVFNPLSYFLINPDGWEFKANGRDYQPLEITDELLEELGLSGDLLFEGMPLYEGKVNEAKLGRLGQSSQSLGTTWKYKGLTLSYDNMYRQDYPALGRTTFVYSYSDPSAKIGEYIQRAALTYQADLNEKLSTTSNVYYLRYRLDNTSKFAVNYDNNYGGEAYVYAASDDFFGEQLITYYPMRNLEIVAGGSLQYSSGLPRTNELRDPFNPRDYRPFSDNLPDTVPVLGSFGFNPISFRNAAAFGQVYFSNEKWTALAGIRFDDNSLYGQSFNPRAAVMYKLESGTSLRASIGSAYKAPAPTLIFNSLAIVTDPALRTATYPITPNPNLGPERVINYELGLRKSFSERISLDISHFGNEVNDLIKGVLTQLDTVKYPNSLPSDRQTRQNVNSEDAEAILLGVQATLRAKNLWQPYNLSVVASMIFSEGTETLPGTDGALNDYRMMPEWIGQLGISFYPVKNLYIFLQNTAMTGWYRRYTPNKEALENPYFRNKGYYTLDVVANYQLNKNTMLFLRTKNVFNQRYGGIGVTGLDVDMVYNPQMLRNIQGGIRFQLD